jgi:hypothetical protein
MKGILTDADIEGQSQVLFTILKSDSWRDFWSHINVPLHSFPDVALSRDALDSEVWHLCQQEQMILITGNRNAEGPDSLEVTLRMCNTAESLPVFTIADVDRVLNSKDYAERVVARLIDYLLEIDRYRGTGRLYLP